MKFLLTTPLETQKKTSGGYRIQSSVADVRDIIMNYCRTHNIAVWDFYRVGGGSGASNRWLKAHYMKTDHLHLGNDGYHLQGQLLATALLRLMNGEDDGSETEKPVENIENDDIPDNYPDEHQWKENSSSDN